VLVLVSRTHRAARRRCRRRPRRCHRCRGLRPLTSRRAGSRCRRPAGRWAATSSRKDVRIERLAAPLFGDGFDTSGNPRDRSTTRTQRSLGQPPVQL